MNGKHIENVRRKKRRRGRHIANGNAMTDMIYGAKWDIHDEGVTDLEVGRISGRPAEREGAIEFTGKVYEHELT